MNGRNALTLYEAEESLQLLVEAEETVSVELQEEYERDLAAATARVVDKRESVARFRLMLDSQIAATAAEVQRLRDRQARLVKAKERLDQRIIVPAALMLSRAKDGRPAKLQAHTATISLQSNPVSVEITDEAQVPDRFKRLTLTIPADLWTAHIHMLKVVQGLDWPPILSAVSKAEVSVDKRAIRDAIQAGELVPGADLRVVGPEFSVRIR